MVRAAIRSLFTRYGRDRVKSTTVACGASQSPYAFVSQARFSSMITTTRQYAGSLSASKSDGECGSAAAAAPAKEPAKPPNCTASLPKVRSSRRDSVSWQGGERATTSPHTKVLASPTATFHEAYH